jgi:hypothetical protein
MKLLKGIKELLGTWAKESCSEVFSGMKGFKSDSRDDNEDRK